MTLEEITKEHLHLATLFLTSMLLMTSGLVCYVIGDLGRSITMLCGTGWFLLAVFLMLFYLRVVRSE